MAYIQGIKYIGKMMKYAKIRLYVPDILGLKFVRFLRSKTPFLAKFHQTLFNSEFTLFKSTFRRLFMLHNLKMLSDGTLIFSSLLSSFMGMFHD